VLNVENHFLLVRLVRIDGQMHERKRIVPPNTAVRQNTAAGVRLTLKDIIINDNYGHSNEQNSVVYAVAMNDQNEMKSVG
jgi:hypothetical protein